MFSNCSTVGAVRSEYRRLAMLHHPDRGGDNETMRAINLAYGRALSERDGEISTGFDGQPHEYHYNARVEKAAMDKVLEILGANLGVKVELIGTWVWVSGDTKPVKEQLKALGLRWHGKRVMWYWHVPSYRRRYSGVSTDALRRAYGSRTFETSEDSLVA